MFADRIRRLIEHEQYQKALDIVKRYSRNEIAKRHLLFPLLRAVTQVEDPLTLGQEHRAALTRVMTMSQEHIAVFPLYIRNIRLAYYPHKVPAMLETFTKAKGFDQKRFMQNILAALESFLNQYLFIGLDMLNQITELITKVQSGDHQRVCPCNEKETCISLDFASFVLSACRPLHYGSSFDVEHVHLNTDDAEHYPLFYTAVSDDLVEEAKLLYETGAVNNSELNFLAQSKPEIQKMLDEDKDTSMATFLRSVMRQPRSLFSAASLEVSRLLGHDVRGRQDRAKNLGLPQILYNEVMFIRPVSDYRNAVKSRCEKEKHEEN